MEVGIYIYDMYIHMYAITGLDCFKNCLKSEWLTSMGCVQSILGYVGVLWPAILGKLAFRYKLL